MVGYFRQFRSAWLWREYLVQTTDAKSIVILDKGSMVNVWKRETTGEALRLSDFK